MVNIYEVSTQTTEEIEYEVIKPQYETWFERTVIEWYKDFARHVPHLIPVITDVFDDSMSPIGGSASEMFAVLENSVAVDFCGIERFPESIDDWTEDHLLYFEEMVDLNEYEKKLFRDVERFLKSKNMTYCRCNPKEVESTSVIGVW
jgi:hypothetical protein